MKITFYYQIIHRTLKTFVNWFIKISITLITHFVYVYNLFFGYLDTVAGALHVPGYS